jgi:acetyltransferase-like isoleucine patch superfamily enzyme
VKAVLLDPGSPESCHPLTATRRLFDCLVGNQPLGERLIENLKHCGFELTGAGEAAGLTAWIAGDGWLSAPTLLQLREAEAPAVVLDEYERPIAWVGESAEPEIGSVRIGGSGDDFSVRYPWELLHLNEILLDEIDEDVVEGDVAAGVHWEGHLILGAGSRLLPGVFIEGTVAIGPNCKIGPNCYLRGRTSIAAGCRVGQAVEIKNSILFPGATIGHLSYCGDSIVGAKVNFGAGTIVANLRHDGRNHRSLVEGELIDTGRRKFGTVVGDGVHTGIHTTIYPGRKLGPHSSTRPGEVVDRDKP